MRLRRVVETNSHANGFKATCLPLQGAKTRFYRYKVLPGVGKVFLLAGLLKDFSDQSAKKALIWFHVQLVSQTFPLKRCGVCPIARLLVQSCAHSMQPMRQHPGFQTAEVIHYLLILD